MNACIIYGIYAIILHDTWLFKNFWLLCSISSTRDTLHCWFSHALLQYFHFILSLLISFHLYMKIFTALNFDNLPFNFFLCILIILNVHLWSFYPLYLSHVCLYVRACASKCTTLEKVQPSHSLTLSFPSKSPVQEKKQKPFCNFIYRD